MTRIARLGVLVFLTCGALSMTNIPVHAAASVKSQAFTRLSTNYSARQSTTKTFAIPQDNFFGLFQQAIGKPAVTNCNGHLYIAWIGTNGAHNLNVGWDPQPGTGFGNNKRIINDYGLYNDSHQPGPAMGCFTTDYYGTQPYVAFTGTNDSLYIGWFNGTSNLQEHTKISDTSYNAPALSQYQGTNIIFLAFTGTNTGAYIDYSTDGFQHTRSHYNITKTNQGGGVSSQNGPGLNQYCAPGYGCNLYYSWVGQDSGHHINEGYFNFSNTLQDYHEVGREADAYSDASATPDSTGNSYFYIAYAGINNTVNTVQSRDGDNWTYNDGNIGTSYSIYGAGAGLDPNGNVRLTWADGNTGDMFLAEGTSAQYPTGSTPQPVTTPQPGSTPQTGGTPTPQPGSTP